MKIFSQVPRLGVATLGIGSRGSLISVDNSLDRLGELTGGEFTVSSSAGNHTTHINSNGYQFPPINGYKHLVDIPKSSVNGNPSLQYVVFGTVSGGEATSVIVAERNPSGGFSVVDSVGGEITEPSEIRVLVALGNPSSGSSSTKKTTQKPESAQKKDKPKTLSLVQKFNDIVDPIFTNRYMITDPLTGAEKLDIPSGIIEGLKKLDIPSESDLPGIRDKILTYCFENPDSPASEAFALKESLINPETSSIIRNHIFSRSYDDNLDKKFYIALTKNLAFISQEGIEALYNLCPFYDPIKDKPDSKTDDEPALKFVRALKQELDPIDSIENLTIERATALVIEKSRVDQKEEIIDKGLNPEFQDREAFFIYGKNPNLISPPKIDTLVSSIKKSPNAKLSEGLGLNEAVLKALKEGKKKELFAWAKENTQTALGRNLIFLLGFSDKLKCDFSKIDFHSVINRRNLEFIIKRGKNFPDSKLSSIISTHQTFYSLLNPQEKKNLQIWSKQEDNSKTAFGQNLLANLSS